MAGASDILNPASDILGVAEGAYQFIDSIGKEKKDRAALANIKDPFYKIQDEYLQNRNLAESQAQGGLPAASKDYLTSESQRGLGAGIGGILQGGGNPNDIAKLFDSYSKSIDRTAAEDADQHIKNIQYFSKVNSDLAGQKTTQWSLNEYQPTQEKKRQLSENIASDKTNAYGGANTAIGSLGALGTSLTNNSLLNKILKDISIGKTSTNNPLSNKTFNDTRPIDNIPTPGMTNSTGYIDPNSPGALPLNYVNPFQ